MAAHARGIKPRIRAPGERPALPIAERLRVTVRALPALVVPMIGSLT
jgi:hypothetical protein